MKQTGALRYSILRIALFALLLHHVTDLFLSLINLFLSAITFALGILEYILKGCKMIIKKLASEEEDVAVEQECELLSIIYSTFTNGFPVIFCFVLINMVDVALLHTFTNARGLIYHLTSRTMKSIVAN